MDVAKIIILIFILLALIWVALEVRAGKITVTETVYKEQPQTVYVPQSLGYNVESTYGFKNGMNASGYEGYFGLE